MLAVSPMPELVMRTPRSVGIPLTLALLLLAVPQSSAEGQLGRVLTRKAREAVERKAEAKVDQKIDQMAGQMVDRSFETIFGADGGDAAGAAGSGGGAGASGASGGRAGGRAGAGLFAAMPDAPTEARYEFDLVISYDLELTEKGKRSAEQATMLTHFSRSAPYTGTRMTPRDARKGDGEAFIIFDAGNESMVMLMTSDEGKFSAAYGWKDAAAFADAAAASSEGGADAEPVDFERIGTRSIAGYPADGYRSTTKDGTTEIWVSRDPALAAGRLFGANASMKQMRGAIPDGYPMGAVLEVNSLNGDGDRMVMRATKVDTGARVRIEMSEYPRLGAGG
jgi:hypothetical protein